MASDESPDEGENVNKIRRYYDAQAELEAPYQLFVHVAAILWSLLVTGRHLRHHSCRYHREPHYPGFQVPGGFHMI